MNRIVSVWWSLEEALDYIKATGCEAVEIGCGAFPGSAHCNPAELLADQAARDAFKEAVTARGLEISALSCHGNPLHPTAARAKTDDAVYRDTDRVSARPDRVGVDRGTVAA